MRIKRCRNTDLFPVPEEPQPTIENSRRAQELIQELDKLSETETQECSISVVALVTSLGLIFSFQKHKLQNLEFVLEHGEAYNEAYGFIVITDGEAHQSENIEALNIKLWTVPDEEEGTFLLLGLIDSINQLQEVYDCGPTYEDINDDFREGLRYCKKCWTRHSQQSQCWMLS
jgi:hypothetical protein